jgi:hypothetical protein
MPIATERKKQVIFGVTAGLGVGLVLLIDKAGPKKVSFPT